MHYARKDFPNSTTKDQVTLFADNPSNQFSRKQLQKAVESFSVGYVTVHVTNNCNY